MQLSDLSCRRLCDPETDTRVQSLHARFQLSLPDRPRKKTDVKVLVRTTERTLVITMHITWLFTPVNISKSVRWQLAVGMARWLERRTRGRKVGVRIPAGAAEKCSSPESTLCADSYSMSVPTPCYRSGTQKTPTILPKVQVAGYTWARIYTLTHRSRSGPTMPLSRQSVGVYQETSTHATHQGTLGYSPLSSLSHCRLILA